MTLWEVAQELRARGERLTENSERQFAYFVAASMIEEWAREKAEALESNCEIEWSYLADLGVPKT